MNNATTTTISAASTAASAATATATATATASAASASTSSSSSTASWTGRAALSSSSTKRDSMKKKQQQETQWRKVSDKKEAKELKSAMNDGELSVSYEIVKTPRGWSLIVSIANCSRKILSMIIPRLNSEIRKQVGACSMIVWTEGDLSRLNKLAKGKITAGSINEEPLERAAKMIIDEITRYDNQVHIDQDQRRQIQEQRRLEFEQRQARKAEFEAKKAQRQENYTLGAVLLKTPEAVKTTAVAAAAAPAAPSGRKFEARVDEFPPLSQDVKKRIDFDDDDDDAESSAWD
jgi:hypothetical protein